MRNAECRMPKDVYNSWMSSAFNARVRARVFPTALLLLLIHASSGFAQTRQPGLGELSKSLQDLAEKVSPTVVQIFVTGYGAPDETDRSTTSPVIERGSGSGVIVDPNGYIVTNAHVVRNASRIEVELPFAAT